MTNKKFFSIKERETGKDLLIVEWDNLINRNFNEKDLRNSNLSNLNMSCSTFKNTKLDGSDFSSSNLTGCDFTGSSIYGTKFDGSILYGCKGLNECFMTTEGRSDFYNASWKGCDFSGVDLSWVEFSSEEELNEFFKECKGIETTYKVFKVKMKKDFISNWHN